MHWELLDRYLADGCTAAERACVEQWLAESSDRRELLEQLTRRSPAASEAQKAEVWARLERQMGLGRKLRGNGA